MNDYIFYYECVVGKQHMVINSLKLIEARTGKKALRLFLKRIEEERIILSEVKDIKKL